MSLSAVAIANLLLMPDRSTAMLGMSPCQNFIRSFGGSCARCVKLQTSKRKQLVLLWKGSCTKGKKESSWRCCIAACACASEIIFACKYPFCGLEAPAACSLTGAAEALVTGKHSSQPSRQPYKGSHRHHNSSAPRRLTSWSCCSSQASSASGGSTTRRPAALQPRETTDADGMQQPRPHNYPNLCHCLSI